MDDLSLVLLCAHLVAPSQLPCDRYVRGNCEHALNKYPTFDSPQNKRVKPLVSASPPLRLLLTYVQLQLRTSKNKPQIEDYYKCSSGRVSPQKYHTPANKVGEIEPVAFKNSSSGGRAYDMDRGHSGKSSINLCNYRSTPDVVRELYLAASLPQPGPSLDQAYCTIPAHCLTL